MVLVDQQTYLVIMPSILSLQLALIELSCRLHSTVVASHLVWNWLALAVVVVVVRNWGSNLHMRDINWYLCKVLQQQKRKKEIEHTLWVGAANRSTRTSSILSTEVDLLCWRLNNDNWLLWRLLWTVCATIQSWRCGKRNWWIDRLSIGLCHFAHQKSRDGIFHAIRIDWRICNTNCHCIGNICQRWWFRIATLSDRTTYTVQM